MNEYLLHLPNTLLAQARKTAKRDHISLEQLFITAIAEKLAALEADSLVKQRAAKADPAAFKRILDQVPHAGMAPGDELTN